MALVWKEAAPTRKKLLEQAATLPEDSSRIIYTFEDGWTIRELMTVGDMSREGQLMGNCIDPADPYCRQFYPMREGEFYYSEGRDDWEEYEPGKPTPETDEYVRSHIDRNSLISVLDDPLRYLSLRDPDNIPRASYDEESDEWLGRHNAPLKPEYEQKVIEFENSPASNVVTPPASKTARILPEMWNDIIQHYEGRYDGAYAYHSLNHNRNKDPEELQRILLDVIFDSGLVSGDEVERRGRDRAYDDEFRSRDGHVYLSLDPYGVPEIRVPLSELDPQYVDSDKDYFAENYHEDMDEIQEGLGSFEFIDELPDLGYDNFGEWANDHGDFIDSPDWTYDSIMSGAKRNTFSYSGPITPDMVEINPRWLNTAEGEHFLEVVQDALANVDENAQIPGQQTFLEDPYSPKVAHIKQAAWSDVMKKAKRYKDEGRVNLIRNGIKYIVSEVKGDTGTYDTEISREDPNSLSITGWRCDCPWGEHSWGRTRQFKKFEGRPCWLPGQKVQTIDGRTYKIEDIPIGTEVLSRNGVGTVTARFENNYKGEMVHIYRSKSESPMIVTADHSMIAKSSDGIWGKIPASEVIEGTVLLCGDPASQGRYEDSVTKVVTSHRDGSVYNITVSPDHTVCVEGVITFQCSHVMATLWTSQSTPLDEESELQQDLPPGIPPTGEAPGIPDVNAPPGEMVESLPIGVDERQKGTVQIPGTFSKAMRKGLDSIISGK